MTSPAPDGWPSILTDYTYDSELDNADGVPHSVSTQLDVHGGECVILVKILVVIFKVKSVNGGFQILTSGNPKPERSVFFLLYFVEKKMKKNVGYREFLFLKLHFTHIFHQRYCM